MPSPLPPSHPQILGSLTSWLQPFLLSQAWACFTLVSLSLSTKGGSTAPDPTPPCSSGKGSPFALTCQYLALVPTSAPAWSPPTPQQPHPGLPVLCVSMSPGAASSHLQLPQSYDLAVIAACLAPHKGKAKTRWTNARTMAGVTGRWEQKEGEGRATSFLGQGHRALCGSKPSRRGGWHAAQEPPRGPASIACLSSQATSFLCSCFLALLWPWEYCLTSQKGVVVGAGTSCLQVAGQ